jgi:hypothetical protein
MGVGTFDTEARPKALPRFASHEADNAPTALGNSRLYNRARYGRLWRMKLPANRVALRAPIALMNDVGNGGPERLMSFNLAFP